MLSTLPIPTSRGTLLTSCGVRELLYMHTRAHTHTHTHTHNACYSHELADRLRGCALSVVRRQCGALECYLSAIL